MWGFFLISVKITVLLLMATQSEPLIQNKKYNYFMDNFTLPVSVHKTITIMNHDEWIVQTCGAACHILQDCFMFCFIPDICVMARTRGNYAVNKNDRENVDALYTQTYICYINDEINKEDSDGIIRVVNTTNIALKKTTKESSLFTESSSKKTYSSSLVVDGNLIRSFTKENKFCLDTKMEEKPWLLISLNVRHLVMFINITNNDNAVQIRRFHDIEVRVGFNTGTSSALANSFTSNTLCAEYLSVADDYWFTPCLPKPVMGQVVSVQIVRNCNGFSRCPIDKYGNGLNVCEVQVFGYKL